MAFDMLCEAPGDDELLINALIVETRTGAAWGVPIPGGVSAVKTQHSSDRRGSTVDYVEVMSDGVRKNTDVPVGPVVVTITATLDADEGTLRRARPDDWGLIAAGTSPLLTG